MTDKVKDIISNSTSIGIGLVITLIGAAVTFGIMWQKVDSMENTIDRIELNQNEISKEITQLKELYYQKLAADKSALIR